MATTGEVFLTRSRSGTNYEDLTLAEESSGLTDATTTDDPTTDREHSAATTFKDSLPEEDEEGEGDSVGEGAVDRVEGDFESDEDDDIKARKLKKSGMAKMVKEERELHSDDFDTDLEDDFPPRNVVDCCLDIRFFCDI